MEVYWTALRECLLVRTSFMVLCSDGQRPIFRIKTLRKAPTEPIEGIVDIFAKRGGHIFMTDLLDCFSSGSLDKFHEGVTPIPKSVLKIARTREKEILKATHKGLGEQFRGLLSFKEEQAAADPERTPRPPKREPGEKMADKIAAKYPKEADMPFMRKLIMAKNAGIRLQPNPSESDLEFGLLLAKEALESEKAKNTLRGNGEGSSKMTEKPDVFESYRKHLINGGKPLSDFTIKTSTQAESRMSAPAAPKEDWGKWQRMGGDPRMHKAFSLACVPCPPSSAEDSGEDKDDDTIKPASEKPDTSIRMRGPMSPAEVEYALEMIQREKQIKTSVDESAQGFAEKDDEAFIPTIDNPNKDKGKGKAPAWSPEKKASAAVQGGQAKNKKVETLRAIFSPGAKQNAMQNSPYLNALGSSGIAPPPGLYNNMASTSSSPVSSFQSGSGISSSFQPNTGMTNNMAFGNQAQDHSGMAGTSNFGFQTGAGIGNTFASGFQTSSGMGSPAASGFQPGSGMGNTFNFGYQSNTGLPSTSLFANWQPPQNPYQPAMNQASTASSPLTSWSHLAPIQPPGSGFYDPVYTGLSNDMTMGGRRSSLGHIARTASRSGFQNTIGTALRADIPAVNFAPVNLGVRTTYQPAGYGVQGNGSARGRSGTEQRHGGASGNASGSGTGDGGQQDIGYNASGNSPSKAAKKWLA
jgi:hypothetical protein